MTRNRAAAVSSNCAENRLVAYLMTGALLLLIAALAFATDARAQEKIIKSHGISTFGDLKYGPDFKHFDYVNPDAPKGGELSQWAFGTFDSMSPFVLKGNAAVGSSMFFESLMTGSSDEPDSMYGLIAESIEYPESRQWAIFNMRPEARFSDGTPVTAEDVVFSFNILTDKGHPSYKILYGDIDGVEALAPHRVKFTFKAGSNTRELPMTAAGMAILSKADWEGREFAESSLEPALGSGPYLPGKIKPGKTVSYVRDPNYWGKDLPVNVGQNNFDTLRWEYYTDYTAAFEGFKGGDYFYREEFLSLLWATSYDFPALKKGWVKKETLPDNRPSGVQGFWFNLRREKLADPRVREAIGMMFNFEWSNQTLFYGLYNRTDSFFENSDMQAEGLPSEEEVALLEPLTADLPDNILEVPAYSPPVSKPTRLDRSVRRKAGRLLDAAGWKLGEGGLRRNANGNTLSVEIVNDSPSFDRIINPYIENLRQLGIDARYTRIDSAQIEERQKKFDYDIVIQRYSMSLTPGNELRQIFGSQSANSPGSANLTGLSNPAIDTLIDLIEKADSRETLNVRVRALDRALRSMHIWVPQWYKASHNIAYLDVYDRPPKKPPYAVGLGTWWWDEAKAERLRAAGAF
ncbi:MAG: extracellular solute-binding protein [Paracoccaceae bacterium]